jgi:hypothetical protein
MMRRPERSTYTSIDFLQWQEAGTLLISPKFQRRGVWNRAARSYLIDTLLLGLPVPPIYIRVVQDIKRRTVVREVVDGQQRVSAILDYVNNKYTLGKNIESRCAGKKFSDLKPEEQETITQYSFVCEVFYGVEDQDILKIFARLNTYSVSLNAQELRNGRFFGEFKQCAYALALEHLEFWRVNKVFSETSIARMQEVELTSELIIAMLAGLQDKKKDVDTYYEEYEEAFPDRVSLESKFRVVIDLINSAAENTLASTEFRRVPLFYSLFAAIYHRIHGLPGEEATRATTGRLNNEELEGLQGAMHTLSAVITAAKEGDTVSKSYEEFVVACLRQTDNLAPRRKRMETIYKLAFK